MSIATKPISMTINGVSVGPFDVPESLMMIDFLHEYVNLTGTRLGCGQGVCRACVVILDLEDGTSQEMRTCITGVGYFAGRKVRTVEAHATHNEAGGITALSAIQQKFLDFYSFQCGYCTPGFVNAATVLVEKLKRHPIDPAQVETIVTEALNDHICRCTGYVRYHQAVKEVIMTTPGLLKSDAASTRGDISSAKGDGNGTREDAKADQGARL